MEGTKMNSSFLIVSLLFGLRCLLFQFENYWFFNWTSAIVGQHRLMIAAFLADRQRLGYWILILWRHRRLSLRYLVFLQISALHWGARHRHTCSLHRRCFLRWSLRSAWLRCSYTFRHSWINLLSLSTLFVSLRILNRGTQLARYVCHRLIFLLLGGSLWCGIHQTNCCTFWSVV